MPRSAGIRTNRTGEEDYRGTSMWLRRDVLERAKTLALRQHISMAEIVETALDEYLTAHGLPRPPSSSTYGARPRERIPDDG
jgi:hypothetical protein